MQPTEQIDSIINTSYIFAWFDNSENPYFNEVSYPSFWELTYLPSLVVAHSDDFFWLASIIPVVLVFLTSYLVGIEMKIPKIVNSIVVFSGILFFQFWLGYSGVGTLKNDMLYAAGIVLIVYAIIKIINSKSNIASGFLFVIGCIFVCTKFSGIIAVIFSVILLVIFCRKKIRVSRHRLPLFVLFILVFVFTTGHYYIYKMIEYHNPVYPVSISLLNYTLFPGNLSMHGTDILSHVNDPDLWKIFINPRNIIWSGIIFPITIITGFIISTSFLLYSISKFSKKKISVSIIFLALFILVTWIFYFGTGFTASGVGTGGLGYIVGLASLRYAEGTIVLTEIFLAWVLLKLGIPKKIIFILFSLNAVSRIYGMLSPVGIHPNLPVGEYYFLAYPVAILLFLPNIKKYLVRERKVITVVSLWIFIFIFSPFVVDEGKKYWFSYWHNTISSVYNKQNTNIVLIAGTTINCWNVPWPLYGNKMQNTVIYMSEESLDSSLQSTNNQIQKPDFIAALCDPKMNETAEFNEMSSKYAKYGYYTMSSDQHAILFGHSR